MILPSGVVIRIASFNMERCYFAVQNLNTTKQEIVYLMQSEEEAETFKRAGFAIRGYEQLEMQNCLNPQSKRAWYAYQETGWDVDIRVLDI